MPGSIPAARKNLIDRIARSARQLGDIGVSVPLTDFVNVYYRGVDEEDLGASGPAHFASAAASHLVFGARRAAGAPLVRVFNPEPDRDGWKSTHTVVEVITDDMPFLVDSLSMVLGQCGLAIHFMAHPVLHVKRDRRGVLRSQELEADPGDVAESWQHVEVDRIGDPAQLEDIRRRILRVLDDVRLSVQDWPTMRRKALEIAETLHARSRDVPAAEKNEAKAFLRWLADNHFTFLGYREYRLVRGSQADRLVPVVRTGLGLMRSGKDRPAARPTVMRGDIRRRAREPALLIVTKANSVSTVHRATYLDYVGIKVIDSRGRVTGERRFIGLFTSSTYSASPREIPLLRHKVKSAIDHFGISSTSHDGKALMHVLETHPRDELFQSSVAELVQTARGIVNLYERRRVRVFVRRDPYRRFFSCLLFVPRDRYNTQVRERIERVLLEELAGTALESQVQISESTLARLHTLVRTDADRELTVDVDRIEARIAEAVRTWSDRLREALLAHMPEDRALQLARAYGSAFPAAYQEEVPATDAIGDITELQALPQTVPSTGLSLRSGSSGNILHLRLYRRGDPIAMSDMLPLLENFDLRILNERPYRIAAAGAGQLWIQDLEVTHAQGRALDPAQVGARFEDAFFAAWNGQAESDGFNRLVLGAGLTWRQAELLRAICRYLLQTGLPFSQRYMEQVLARHPQIAERLVWSFETRFDPALKTELRAARLKPLVREIEAALERVTSPDDDRILRAFRSVIDATLRTNRYQRASGTGEPKPYLSLKLDPKSIPELPKPRPMFEVWVYSPRVEGVHLRMGKVARGGIRWSDRREDFRTEILGLMKAQNVKNTLIVPVGAKGGFFPKRPPQGDREAIQREGVECYRMLIRGLLDLTDNVKGTSVVPPVDVVRYDPDDPYLVVAADKGTASFSDIANALSAEYSFWLGDAFASGGSAGYDHKKMGITARGAWECVKRHFREMGIDTQSQEFTVAGIGDMAGDVFGNGLLSSRHIRLLAAFNHQHIFIDPAPDAARSFRERERLFNLPRSTWNDYDRKAISAGGGVFPRDAKELALSPQARAMLGIDSAKATPNQVVRAILRLPVDLLWNGGIGTYVKASWEANSAVGDRSNDAVRVDGKELRCKVLGEGGNLGFSQLGRIEYAMHGGRLNTDFVDNSGGVDCSDHEVNIKILLDVVQRKTGLKRRERDKLLATMTDDVAALVLRDNYLQSQAISLQEAAASDRLGEHAHLMRALEVDGLLDRGLEFLPSSEEIEERRRAGRGLTRPELAMLLSYSKIALNSQLVQSDVPEDPYLSRELDRYFPDRLSKRYSALLPEHRLRREIIVTATTNSIVNRMGPNFVHRAQQDTGADAATVARAYSIAREAFDVRLLWGRIERLDNRIPATVQYDMIQETVALIRQVTYWLIQRHRSSLGIEMQVARLRPGIQELERTLAARLSGVEKETFDTSLTRLSAAHVPLDLARSIAVLSAMQCAPDIVELAQSRKLPVNVASDAYFGIGSHLGLDWVRQRIESLDTEGHWHAVARGSLREALYQAHRDLVQRVLTESRERDPAKALKSWEGAHAVEVSHARGVVNDIRAQQSTDFASLSVALQVIRRLAGA